MQDLVDALRRAALIAAVGLMVAPAGVLSQTRTAANAAVAPAWPRQPVKLLVGFPGGSTPDMAARALAEGLAKSWGQPVIVENRPGASGNIAANAVAKAGDDHTLGVVINGNLTSAKLLNPKLPFDPAKDFAFLSLLTSGPLVLVTTPDQPSGGAFFTAARNGGDKWNYGSVGIGSVGHLGMEYLKSRVGGIRAQHIPYNGNPAVVTAMLGGQIQMALMPPGVALPQVRAGKLKAIGLTGGRSTLAPEVPPLSDFNVRVNELEVWTALVGPAKLSAAAQARVIADVPAVVRSVETRQRLFNAGWQALGTAPDALKSRVRSETSILGGIILIQGIKAE
jgi:tripartite-type tricarboxylate transporter receptor subunit TctC